MVQRSGWLPISSGISTGARVCAIGDVHGCARQFNEILTAFAAELGDYDETSLVLTGDLNDRGPDSVRAIDTAIAAHEHGFNRLIPLMGNHEQMLRLASCSDHLHERRSWFLNGGTSVMRELGLSPEIRFAPTAEFTGAITAALGAERMRFLHELSYHWRIGNLLFVHAGIDFSNSLDAHLAQPWHLLNDWHWAWIRAGFLNRTSPYPDLTIIHGHTPVNRSLGMADPLQPHLLNGGKINLDGGSFGTGFVAAAEFIPGAYRISLAGGAHG
ncbi:MAG: metallophosphoesterase [Rhodobacteraceae bacterium]|nr:metallophosphoesterase [Paracoccaceae bacterium]